MKIHETLTETRKKLSKQVAEWQLAVDTYPVLWSRLEELKIEPRFNAQDGIIDVAFAGDAEQLRRVWRELRAAGFKPDFHPKEKEPSFSTYWRSGTEGASILWMYFTSTSCKRVKIGTETVEQPVYETQCESHGIEEESY